MGSLCWLKFNITVGILQDSFNFLFDIYMPISSIALKDTEHNKAWLEDKK